MATLFSAGRMPLTPLELLCFGPPRANLAGRKTPRVLDWKKHLALLTYLALSPSRSRTRDHLLGILWPEQPEHAARKALNTAVNRLRGALGDERLRSDGNTLTLTEQRLDVDAVRFEAEAEASPETAVALLRGAFLEGLNIKNAQGFDEWMMHRRTHYHAVAAATLVAAGEQRVGEAPSQAADFARRALTYAPHGESAMRLLMRAEALAGNSGVALAEYRAFAERLQKNIAEQPGRALAALAERIRSQNWRPPGSKPPRPIPLVGRAATHRSLFDAVAQLGARSGGGPRTVVIGSPPGFGRSRLVAECTQRLALEGAQVLQIRPVENDQDARWSALRLLLSSGFASLPGLAGARPDALGALAGLVPDLAARYPPRETKDVADMGSALANALSAVAEEQPLALVIDDAHWADGTSLAALGAALGQLKNTPVMLLLTHAQGVNEPPSELLKLEKEVGRDIPGLGIRLGPLEDDDLRQLVAALAKWCRDKEQQERLTRRIVYESAGNPFFAVTLLSALAEHKTFRKDMIAWPPPGRTIEAPWPRSIPDAAGHAVLFRLGALKNTRAIRVLNAAAVLGGAFDLAVIMQVSELSRPSVEKALPLCERRHLIHFATRRYAFTSPFIVEVVRAACLLPSERLRLERRAIDALAGRKDLESRATRVDLLARARPDQEALDLALELARDASQAGARRLANRALTAAEQIRQEIT